LRHAAATYGSVGILAPMMKQSPADSMASWLTADTIPVPATTVTSARSWAAMKDVTVGSIVSLSALSPSKASAMSRNRCGRWVARS
jgi:hypothetical protein